METATESHVEARHNKPKYPADGNTHNATGTPSASQLYKQYLGKWQQTYGTAPYTPPGTTEKKFPMTMAQWLIVAKKKGLVSADGTVHNAGGPTGQPDSTTAKKHHADAVAAKKKSKILLYTGIGVGILTLGFVIHHFTKKHHHKAA